MKRKRMDFLLNSKAEQQIGDFELFHVGILGRCSECGRLIMLPCLACAVDEKERGHDEYGEVSLEPELFGEVLKRYQRVRAYRERHGISMFEGHLFTKHDQ